MIIYTWWENCMAERVGFEPTWGKAPNRFRVCAGMTASVPLRGRVAYVEWGRETTRPAV